MQGACGKPYLHSSADVKAPLVIDQVLLPTYSYGVPMDAAGVADLSHFTIQAKTIEGARSTAHRGQTGGFAPEVGSYRSFRAMPRSWQRFHTKPRRGLPCGRFDDQIRPFPACGQLHHVPGTHEGSDEG